MVSTLLVLLIGGVFVGGATYSALRAGATAGKQKYAKVIGYSLLAIGGLGFFGTIFSAVGGLGSLASFEWPAGSVRGIVVMPDGKRVVPLEWPGRIQVYDSAWRFLRGWHVDAGGGAFTLRLGDTNTIEVFTARGQKRYVYGLGGEIFSHGTYAPSSYSDFYVPGEHTVVPTRWWMWMLTSPFHSWIVGALGGVLLFLCARKTRNEVA
jgi:hypothetical protein